MTTGQLAVAHQAAVIGAGPAGSVAARLLAEAGLRVVLIDRGRSRAFKAGETLPPAANPLLRRLGIWDLLEAGHLRCPGNQSAFGAFDLTDLDFVYSANGSGWHLDRLRFESQLRSQAQSAGVDLIVASLTSVCLHGPHSELALDNGAQLTADFVIDASGGARAVLRRIGVEETRFDRLAACIGIYACSHDQDQRTLIEAVQEGWWYSSGLPDGRRVVMFFTDTDQPQFREIQAGFKAAVARTGFISERLRESGAQDHSALFTEPAHSAHAMQVAGPGWLAIGDAAMRFDPLSSQGLWTSFMSAEQAVKAILAHSDAGLRTYAGWCYATYQSYLKERQTYYAMETRWAGQTFWSRRMAQAEDLTAQHAL